MYTPKWILTIDNTILSRMENYERAYIERLAASCLLFMQSRHCDILFLPLISDIAFKPLAIEFMRNNVAREAIRRIRRGFSVN